MQTCDLLIKDGSLLIKYDQLEEHVDMAVRGRILETGKGLWKKYQAVGDNKRKGKLFMPGLIGQPYAHRAAAVKGPGSGRKAHNLDQSHASFESTLTPEKMRLCAQAAALEMIKCGTAGFIDAGSYFMEAAASVYRKAV